VFGYPQKSLNDSTGLRSSKALKEGWDKGGEIKKTKKKTPEGKSPEGEDHEGERPRGGINPRHAEIT
jgi:hypothetical protein